MPGWSPEIANELIRLAAADGRALDQLQLQNLVYLAHGWCLAITGQPLTGDRPEAMEFGPAYRRMLAPLAQYGLSPVTRQVRRGEVYPNAAVSDENGPATSDLDAKELAILRATYHSYGALSATELFAVTRRGETPWKQVFDEGRGKFRDISHELIRAQFVQLASRSSGCSP